MYCNNCGKLGHMSKNCDKPITSYGVLLVTNINEIPKIIMIQRKDSICYIELIRGKYNINDDARLKILFERISAEESDKLKNNNFKKLWNDLWLIDDASEIKYIKEFKNSESLFNKLDKEKYIVKSKYSDTEWEFPKGKKNKNEENYMCAKRELEEETNIKEEDYELIKNISPIIENFKGENNINYRNIYYVGICNEIKNIKVDINNRDQLSEIKDVKILTKNEAIDNIRDYNITKIDIINSIFNFIDKYTNDLVFK